jgi:hypothetical protein
MPLEELHLRRARCHKFGPCKGGGGPAHQLAKMFGISKPEEAWTVLKEAAAGDAAAKQKVEAVLGERGAKFDAGWMEAKLAKMAEKLEQRAGAS